MTRWADDPEQAADTLIGRGLDDIKLEGRVLLVNQSGALPALVAGRNIDATVWNRRLTGLPSPAPWPPPGPFDVAVVRLPKARDELEMTAHAVLSVLVPGGRFILYGGNDEGIRSAMGMLEAISGPVETIAARGHGRILAMQRLAAAPLPKGRLHEWRIEERIEIAGKQRAWISYPGTFAAGQLDEGTALLLANLPALATHARVLDYGCGTGVIGAALLERHPTLSLDMIDNDTVALEAARENVSGARTVLGTSLADASRTYDLIVSNPPLHQGIAADRAVLDRLITDAPKHLAPDGKLQIVVQRRLPLEHVFAQHFGGSAVVAENGRYRVWLARQ